MSNKTQGGFAKVSHLQFLTDTLKQIGYSKEEVEGIVSGGDLSYYKTISDNYADLKLPQRGTTGSAGYDVFSPFDFTLNPQEDIVVPTGIRCAMEHGYFLDGRPRSGLGFKYLRISNVPATIDEDFFLSDNEGHIMIKVRNEGLQPIVVKKGGAFCQLVLQKYFIFVTETTPTESRNGGFGSTDEKRN